MHIGGAQDELCTRAEELGERLDAGVAVQREPILVVLGDAAFSSDMVAPHPPVKATYLTTHGYSCSRGHQHTRGELLAKTLTFGAPTRRPNRSTRSPDRSRHQIASRATQGLPRARGAIMVHGVRQAASPATRGAHLRSCPRPTPSGLPQTDHGVNA
jgi:hypothetical protein